MITGRARVECQFCKEVCVTAFHEPIYKEGRTSRISAGSKTSFHRVPERYFIQGDCPNRGRKNKDIQACYDGTYEENKLTHEERIKRKPDARLPSQIES